MLPVFTNPTIRRSGASFIVAIGAMSLMLWPSLANALIVDGAHNWGNSYFFFLPPMVEAPDLPGSFDPTLDPVVEIVDLATDTLVAQFTTDDAVRIDDSGSAYVVTWHTRDFDLGSGRIYRTYVSVEGVYLGFADIVLVDSHQEARNVDSGEFVPLVNGHNLPIKFAIQR